MDIVVISRFIQYIGIDIVVFCENSRYRSWVYSYYSVEVIILVFIILFVVIQVSCCWFVSKMGRNIMIIFVENYVIIKVIVDQWYI